MVGRLKGEDMSYFVIKNSDGDTMVEELTKEELLERLNAPDEWYDGDVEFFENNSHFIWQCRLYYLHL